jgi:hypothetical protein
MAGKSPKSVRTPTRPKRRRIIGGRVIGVRTPTPPPPKRKNQKPVTRRGQKKRGISSSEDTKKQEAEIRKSYVDSSDIAQDEWSKTILTLSAASLGLSISFVKDIVGKSPELLPLLHWAWFLWGTGLMITLLSYGLSYLAFQRAIYELDSEKEVSGGVFTVTAHIGNILSGAAFLTGLGLFIWFVIHNWQHVPPPVTDPEECISLLLQPKVWFF